LLGPATVRIVIGGVLSAVALFILIAPAVSPAVDTFSDNQEPSALECPVGVGSEEFVRNGYLRSLHEQLNVSYPPRGMTLVALKQERVLEIWSETEGGPVFIKSYSFCAASGRLGPKLKRGDKQVPEGVYQVVHLNENSNYHLSLLLDYPNGFDKEMAVADGREDLGADICIHGGCASIGCIALGDDAIEEVFGMATDVGIDNCRAIIAPYDFRMHGPPSPRRELRGPDWVGDLYKMIARELKPYRRAA